MSWSVCAVMLLWVVLSEISVKVAVGGIVGISVKVAVGDIVGVSGKVAVGCVVRTAVMLSYLTIFDHGLD